MDAERLAAIRKGAEDYRGGDHGWETYWYATGYILELCDHIDALQAENERLQDDVCIFKEHLAIRSMAAQSLQARVTLLEGLLGEARPFIAQSWGYGPLLERIDAALSRCDADATDG